MIYHHSHQLVALLPVALLRADLSHLDHAPTPPPAVSQSGAQPRRQSESMTMALTIRDSDDSDDINDAVEWMVARTAMTWRKWIGKLYTTQEAAQEAAIAIASAAKTFDPERTGNSPVAYFGRAVKCRFFTAYKQLHGRKEAWARDVLSLDDSPPGAEETTGAAIVPDTRYRSNGETREHIATLTDYLRSICSDAEYRAIMLQLDGHDYQAIAKIMGTDAKSIDNTLARARAKVRDTHTDMTAFSDAAEMALTRRRAQGQAHPHDAPWRKLLAENIHAMRPAARRHLPYIAQQIDRQTVAAALGMTPGSVQTTQTQVRSHLRIMAGRPPDVSVSDIANAAMEIIHAMEENRAGK